MKKKVEKLVEENFQRKDSFKDDELEDDSLFKKSVGDILDDRIEEFPTDQGHSKFHCNVFPGDVFLNDQELRKSIRTSFNAGKDFFDSPSEDDSNYDSDTDEMSQNKRKRINQTVYRDDEDGVDDSKESETVISDQENSTEEQEYEEVSDPVDESIHAESRADIEEESVSDESDAGSEDGSLEDESEIEDDLPDADEKEDNSSFVYSGGIRNVSSELEKGVAVRNQLNFWEILLESRITLQKCLADANKLPNPENFNNLWSHCSQENKNSIVDCREKLWDLLEKLLHLQCKFRKQCSEFMDTLDRESNEKVEVEFGEETFKVKRRKLTEYANTLKEQHEVYASFRDGTIQKWNDRTKIATGKFAKSNFSAFDQPILKQIEHIMSDKLRLIQRTHIKRSEYKIIGENEWPQSENVNSNAEVKNEIFDDDDFYHKLLRDYIERKTADISDPTQLSKKWIKLQSLRNKMKRKIDTRRTKGRKIKFDVHPKLVNFMAPNALKRWEDNAVNELYSSVFGKTLLNS